MKFHLAMILLVLATAAVAQEQLPAPATLDQWFTADKESHLPGWSVHVKSPTLTFQLRYAVSVRAEGDIAKAHLAGHDLHVFVRVTDGHGWRSVLRHNSLSRLPNKADLAVSEDFFARPGDYRVALVVYDPQADAHGTWFKFIHVPQDDHVLQYSNEAPVEFIDPSGPFLSDVKPMPLPLDNPRQERIDIVVNLTERMELELSDSTAASPPSARRSGSATPDWMLDRSPQDVVTESLLSMAEVLAALRPAGCVRISVFDTIRAKSYLDRSSSFDPAAILAELKRNRNVTQVDQRTLALRLKSASFFRNFVQKIIDDGSGCGSAAVATTRTLIVLSDELVFPRDEPLQSAEPAVGNQMQCYLLRVAIPDYSRFLRFDFITGSRMRMAAGRFDEVARLMADLHPHRFDIAQPRDFEKAFPHLRDGLCNDSTRDYPPKP